MLDLDGTAATSVASPCLPPTGHSRLLHPGVLGTWEAGSPLLKSGRWRVQSCSAMDGRGVIPGTPPPRLLFEGKPAFLTTTTTRHAVAARQHAGKQLKRSHDFG
jgi:hypothetical protein